MFLKFGNRELLNLKIRQLIAFFASLGKQVYPFREEILIFCRTFEVY